MRGMMRIVAILLCLSAAPALAQQPEQPLDFELLPESKPTLKVDESEVRLRRTLLTLHKGVGLGMFALSLANTVVGQLNYSDRFASGPSTGQYQLAQQTTSY